MDRVTAIQLAVERAGGVEPWLDLAQEKRQALIAAILAENDSCAGCDNAACRKHGCQSRSPQGAHR